MDGRTDGRMNGRTDGSNGSNGYERVERVRTDGERTNGRTDGRTDGRTNGRTNGQTDELICAVACVSGVMVCYSHATPSLSSEYKSLVLPSVF